MSDSLQDLIMDNLTQCEKCPERPVFLTLMDYQNHHLEFHEALLNKPRECWNFNEKHLITTHLNYSTNSAICSNVCGEHWPPCECNLSEWHEGKHNFYLCQLQEGSYSNGYY